MPMTTAMTTLMSRSRSSVRCSIRDMRASSASTADGGGAHQRLRTAAGAAFGTSLGPPSSPRPLLAGGVAWRAPAGGGCPRRRRRARLGPGVGGPAAPVLAPGSSTAAGVLGRGRCAGPRSGWGRLRLEGAASARSGSRVDSRRRSPMALPTWRAASGRRCGPSTIRAISRMTRSSPPPMLNIGGVYRWPPGQARRRPRAVARASRSPAHLGDGHLHLAEACSSSAGRRRPRPCHGAARAPGRAGATRPAGRPRAATSCRLSWAPGATSNQSSSWRRRWKSMRSSWVIGSPLAALEELGRQAATRRAATPEATSRSTMRGSAGFTTDIWQLGQRKT